MPKTALLAADAVSIAITAAAPLTAGSGRQLSEFRSRLLRKLGNRGDIDNTDLDRYINDAYLKLAGEADLEELEASASSAFVEDKFLYNLGDAVDTISYVGWRHPYNDDTVAEGLLDKIDLSTFRRLPEEEGPPRAYFRQGSLLVVWPTPDEAIDFQIDFRVRPEPLTDDTHRTLFGTNWDNVIQMYAAYFGHEDLGEAGLAKDSLNMAVAEMRSKIMRKANEKDSIVGRISIPRTQEELTSIQSGVYGVQRSL